MRLLGILTMAAAIAGCGQTGDLAGEITIGDQTFEAADVIAWQQPSPLNERILITTVTIAATQIDRELAARSLQRLGFFAPDALHVQLTILADGHCQGYDIGTVGTAASFWTGNSIDLICSIRVGDSKVSGSVTTTEIDPATPLRHGFDLSFQTEYLQWK